MGKISVPEGAAVLLAGGFLAFSLGWLARGGSGAPPVRLETAAAPVPEVQEEVLPAPSCPAPGPASALPAESAPRRVDLNRAGVEELMGLPGIGRKRAEDIVADRTANGPFLRPEDLTRVPGIGEATMARVLPWITAGEEQNDEDTGR